MERLRAPGGDLGLDLAAQLGRDGRSKLQVGERRAQVKPGPAHHDRPPALGKELVDLGMRKARELPRAELAAHVDEADEPVL